MTACGKNFNEVHPLPDGILLAGYVATGKEFNEVHPLPDRILIVVYEM